MDPVAIATGITTLLLPFAKKAFEAFADEAGKKVFGKTAELLGRLKAHLSSEPIAADVLNRFEQSPDRYQPLLTDMLIERLRAEPALASELANSLEEIRKSAPELHIVQDVVKAQMLVGADIGTAAAGRISVQQKVGDVGYVVGAKIDKIG